MSWFRRLALVTMTMTVAAGCGAGPSPSTSGNGYETVQRVTTAEELNILLDADGRPLAGSSLQDQLKHEFDVVGDIVVPDGELLLMDGINIWIGPNLDQAVPIDLPVEEMELLALRGHDAEGRSFASNAIVMLRVPGTAPITYWGDLEYAYGTDGGLGGFTNPLVVDKATNELPSDNFVDLDLDASRSLFDLDGVPGADTFVFQNGWGTAVSRTPSAAATGTRSLHSPSGT